MVCAVSQGAEEAFKKTVEVDRFIDTLRDANPKEVSVICNFCCLAYLQIACSFCGFQGSLVMFNSVFLRETRTSANACWTIA